MCPRVSVFPCLLVTLVNNKPGTQCHTSEYMDSKEALQFFIN